MPLKLGNRVTEKDIREWLDKQAFHGKSAQISDLELHAIKRPGWVQLFRFRVRVKRASNSPDSELEGSNWEDQLGVVLDDERVRNPDLKTQVWLFDTEQQQAEKLETFSADMLTCRTGQNGNVLGVAGLFILLFIVAVLSMSILY